MVGRGVEVVGAVLLRLQDVSCGKGGGVRFKVAVRVGEVEGMVPDQVRIRVGEGVEVEVGVVCQHDCLGGVSTTQCLSLFGQ